MLSVLQHQAPRVTCSSASHAVLHALLLAPPVSDRVRVCKESIPVLGVKTEKQKTYWAAQGGLHVSTSCCKADTNWKLNGQS